MNNSKEWNGCEASDRSGELMKTLTQFKGHKYSCLSSDSLDLIKES